MPLDPQVKGLLDLLTSMGAPPLAEGTPQSGRDGFRTLTVDMRDPAAVVPVAATQDIQVDGAEGPLAARVYRPEVAPGTPVPTVVFFHGGGFVIGDLDTHDNQCRWVCREVGAVVVSVDYRLAPESPFPGPVEDCLAATRWAATHIAELGNDPGRLVVGGDSAGGNLAAVVSQIARDKAGPALAAQLLIYPAVDFVEDTQAYPSRVENAEGYFLTASDMLWFGANYAGGTADKTDPRLSPLHGELAGLPPAVVVTAEFDPLRDEGEAYADALEKAGVRVLRHRFDGLIHGFFDLPGLSPACADAMRVTLGDLRTLLTPQG